MRHIAPAGYGEGSICQEYGRLFGRTEEKVLIAASLLTPAHLYIWDEPLNYIDVFSRMQIEKLLMEYKPAMLVVEHDVRFREQVATKTVELGIGDCQAGRKGGIMTGR